MHSAQHLSKTAEHFTPKWLAELAHETMGGIDLDPASHNYANEHIVAADSFYAKEDDGLTKPWHGRLFLNVPGDKLGKTPQTFWAKLSKEVVEGNVSEFFWVAFNNSHLRTLQNACTTLLQASDICVLKKRVRYTGNSPTHDSSVIYWGPNGEHFEEVMLPHGAVWQGIKHRFGAYAEEGCV